MLLMHEHLFYLLFTLGLLSFFIWSTNFGPCICLEMHAFRMNLIYFLFFVLDAANSCFLQTSRRILHGVLLSWSAGRFNHNVDLYAFISVWKTLCGWPLHRSDFILWWLVEAFILKWKASAQIVLSSLEYWSTGMLNLWQRKTFFLWASMDLYHNSAEKGKKKKKQLDLLRC